MKRIFIPLFLCLMITGQSKSDVPFINKKILNARAEIAAGICAGGALPALAAIATRSNSTPIPLLLLVACNGLFVPVCSLKIHGQHKDTSSEEKPFWAKPMFIASASVTAATATVLYAVFKQ